MWRGDYRAVPALVVTEEDERECSPPRRWVGRQMSGKLSACSKQGHKDREDRRRERLNSELIIAVLRSDGDSVKRLLQDGAHPEACCRTSMCSTVHIAALRGEMTILKLLLESGANGWARDRCGRQPIHFACWSGYVSSLKVLIEAYPDLLGSPVAMPSDDAWKPEQEDSWDHNHDEVFSMLPDIALGSTPLHIACKLSKVQVVEFLLEAGANVNLRDGQGLTPLDVAGLHGAGKPSSGLAKGPNHLIVSYNDHLKQQMKQKNQNYPTLEDLWSHKPYFSQKNFTSSVNSTDGALAEDFVIPSREGSPPVPPSILKDERMSPLHGSDTGKSAKPLYDIVNALIDKGARITSIQQEEDLAAVVKCQKRTCGTALLHTAVANKDLELIDYLLENGADLVVLNENGESPLHLAVKKKLSEPLKTMLSWLELDLIDLKSSAGLTSLHQAVLEEWTSGVGLLLEAGADVRLFTDSSNETVFHIAAKTGNQTILEELLTVENALEVIDAVDRDGYTPLFRAIQNGLPTNVDMLLKFGVNLELTLDGEVNILHYAVENKSMEILRLLLQEVICLCPHLINALCSEDKGGLSPLHIAAKKGGVGLVKLLLKNGANLHLPTTNEPFNESTALHLAAQRGFSKTVTAILEFDDVSLKNKDYSGWTPLHVASCFGHGKCVVTMLRYGANIADTVSYHGATKSALDLIVLNVPKCIDLFDKLLDSYVNCDNCSVKYSNCAIELNFDILLGPTMADPTEDKQLIFLSTLLNNGNDQLKQRIMLHPLVESFLYLKWKNMRKFFIMLLVFYIIHTVSLTMFSVLTFVEKKDMSRAWSCSVLLVVLIPIVTTEILNALPLKRYYFLDNESWIKWSVIISSIITVTIDPAKTETRHFASLSVLLSWTELLFLLARFPAWGLHVLMFEKVAANIFQVLTRFAFLFVGFLFAFMIHFEGVSPFGNVWEALCKVLVMVVELDYGGAFDANAEITGSSLVGRIMYVSFILLVAMAMTNLIVGMAVSDVAVLENQGRTQRLAKQTAFLSFLELCVYNEIILKCLPVRVQNLVKEFRSVPARILVHPNKSSESLPSELRANLLSKAMDKQEDKEYTSMAEQIDKLNSIESTIKEMSTQLNSLCKAFQQFSNQTPTGNEDD